MLDHKPKHTYITSQLGQRAPYACKRPLVGVKCLLFLRMHGGHDSFAMVVNFINSLMLIWLFNFTIWEPTLVIVGIFEVHNTIGVAMANQVKV
jgi:hypothetical protein